MLFLKKWYVLCFHFLKYLIWLNKENTFIGKKALL